MLIISTAGHVDHGKTSLIKALNDFNGDSTPEELRRAITIDLSFSHLEHISFVDVPGHESLIKTMISGVQSDYAMLVVDINEGLMPQSLEHIFILKILGVKNIILVLNKIDICDDCEIKREKILAELDFQPVRCFLVSAKSGAGVAELKQYLLSLKAPSYEDFALKINIDRVFNVKGVGTVATGVLKSGLLECKNYLNDQGESVAVKSIEVQHKSIDCIAAPARVAFVYKGSLKPGSQVYSRGFLRSAKEIYTTLEGSLKHGETVLFCVANKQVQAKYLEFGEFAKFVLEKPLALCFDEPFIVLKNARAQAGGVVLNPLTEPLKKPKMLELLRSLKAKDFKSAFRLLNQNHSSGFGLFCAPQRFNLSTEQALNYAKQVGEIVDEKGACVYTKKALSEIKAKINEQFCKNPHSLQSAKSLAKSLNSDEFLCELALASLENLTKSKGLYHLKGANFEKLIESNEERIFKLLDTLTPAAPYNIYDELNLDRASGDNILKRLCSKNLIKRLAHNYFLSTKALDIFLSQIRPALASGIGVQELKNSHNLSRKYAIALLEHVDTLAGVKNIDNKRYLRQD